MKRDQMERRFSRVGIGKEDRVQINSSSRDTEQSTRSASKHRSPWPTDAEVKLTELSLKHHEAVATVRDGRAARCIRRREAHGALFSQGQPVRQSPLGSHGPEARRYQLYDGNYSLTQQGSETAIRSRKARTGLTAIATLSPSRSETDALATRQTAQQSVGTRHHDNNCTAYMITRPTRSSRVVVWQGGPPQGILRYNHCL